MDIRATPKHTASFDIELGIFCDLSGWEFWW